MLAALNISDGWLQTLVVVFGGIIVALIGWLGNNQRRSNDSLRDTASSVEKVATIVEAHGERLNRIERWQDADRYAEVIEHRAREHR